MADDEPPLYVAYESRVTAGLMMVVGTVLLVIANLMRRELAPVTLTTTVGSLGATILFGAVWMYIARREEFRVDREGVTVRRKPTIPWHQLGDVVIREDSEGDKILVAFVDREWWEEARMSRLARFVARELTDDEGRPGFTITSMALAPKLEERVEAIEAGYRRYVLYQEPDEEPSDAELEWPDAEPLGASGEPEDADEDPG